MICRHFISILICLMGVSHIFAQQDIVRKFERRSHILAAKEIPYRLFVPESYDDARNYPIVLTLHGSGERGVDNLVQITEHRLATSWADPANQVNYPTLQTISSCIDQNIL